jgi:hypothetical protein
MLDTGQDEQNLNEVPTLYHIVRAHKRKTQRAVHSITTTNGQKFTSTRDKLSESRIYFSKKYDIIPNDKAQASYLTRNIDTSIQAAASDALAQPLTMGEVYYALQQGKKNKSPGIDGIG